MIAEGDLVAVYFIFESKHTGTPFAGVPATGKSVTFSYDVVTYF
ncbi:ester cyclase [Bacillus subtilis]|nr:ester cyclase [Bacillus subtilis]